MPAVYSASRLDRVFVQAQAASTPRTIPNAGGTWTNTGAILARHQSLTLTQNNQVVEVPYKTGTRSTVAGIAGRKSGAVSLTVPLIPSGVAGTLPDLDMIFKSAFGQAATGTVTKIYNFNETGVLPFALFRFNRSGGSSPTHQLAGGCIPQRLTFNLGGEVAMMTVDAKCVFVSDSAQFSSYTTPDDIAKFALTAWPTEPTAGAPITVAGNIINGWGGSATFDNNVQADMRGTPSITINTGLDYAEDTYQDAYPAVVTCGKRTVSVSGLKFIDNDQSALNNLKVKAFTKSAINISLVVNNTAGSIVTFGLVGVQLTPWSLVENGNAFDINFGDSAAHASAIGTIDDLTLTFS